MNYWESNAWLVVLVMQIAIMCFSASKLSWLLTSIYLVSYNLLPIWVDTYDVTAPYSFTASGLLALIFVYIAFRLDLIRLCLGYSVMFLFFFVNFTARAWFVSEIPDNIYFVTAYAIEALIILLTLGARRGQSIDDVIDAFNMGFSYFNSWLHDRASNK